MLVPCMFPALSNTRGLGKPLKPPLLLSPGHTPTLIPYKDIPQAHPLLGEQGNLLLVLTFLRCSRNTTKPCLNFLSGFYSISFFLSIFFFGVCVCVCEFLLIGEGKEPWMVSAGL